jgi:hypothetical protein
MKNQCQEDFLRNPSVKGTKSSPLQGEVGGVYEK